MAVKIWSLTGDKTFQGLCPMEMVAESLNDTKQCQICVVPIQQLIAPPPPECGGTSQWRSVTFEGEGLVWVLQSNDCTGTGTPISPPSPPASEALTAVTDCCTGDVISIG